MLVWQCCQHFSSAVLFWYSIRNQRSRFLLEIKSNRNRDFVHCSILLIRAVMLWWDTITQCSTTGATTCLLSVGKCWVTTARLYCDCGRDGSCGCFSLHSHVASEHGINCRLYRCKPNYLTMAQSVGAVAMNRPIVDTCCHEVNDLCIGLSQLGFVSSVSGSKSTPTIRSAFSKPFS